MAQPGWKAEYAYTTGMQAFIYGFPYMYNAKLRHDWVTSKRDPEVVPYAAVNHFWHASRLIDAGYRDGGCPNNDTLYSVAWLDLGEEPVILSHPDMGGRDNSTFELMGFTPSTPTAMSGSAPPAARPGISPSAGRVGTGSCRPGCGRSSRRRHRGSSSWAAPG